MNEVTQLLEAVANGDPSAASQVLPLIYDELRRLAAQKLASEKPGQTLQPTALVHEAYLRLVGGTPEPHWNGRSHFFAAAAEAMRHILVDNARRKRRAKHGGGRQRVPLDDVVPVSPESPDDLLRGGPLVILDAARTGRRSDCGRSSAAEEGRGAEEGGRQEGGAEEGDRLNTDRERRAASHAGAAEERLANTPNGLACGSPAQWRTLGSHSVS
jgi:DNA-directed RNA polymerase specialized sigma24 family protein